ncbi:MAG: hypothetical protein D6755_00990 [Anaerolineae bacterium]|nr:MAG: hypothetical protein D6755_00990 [Anaerolineae bacterium]
MAVKLLMTWDIRPGREQDYFEFVVREFMPGLQRLGLEPSDAWYTMYGTERHPQIMAGVLAPTRDDLTRILASSQWDTLIENLNEYVERFQYKIVSARRGFQL